ncbi:hypothetical protein SAMN06295879_3646 [Agreia bicolorata]|uniref:Pilus assembly protein CpaE n=1 Tax=Agreia bicolorata TaxID=110935 RepID=A0A1T4YMK5_9MICO|nr:hypothetical protein SAMN06295879_3646 [Agreia bicolorata]
MITVELARSLRDAGLVWKPASGDRFSIDTPAFDPEALDAEVFTVSDMTIEAQHYPTGTILGFNGTTEWALDSVELHEALWLPREDQPRDAPRCFPVTRAAGDLGGLGTRVSCRHRLSWHAVEPHGRRPGRRLRAGRAHASGGIQCLGLKGVDAGQHDPRN